MCEEKAHKKPKKPDDDSTKCDELEEASNKLAEVEARSEAKDLLPTRKGSNTARLYFRHLGPAE